MMTREQSCGRLVDAQWKQCTQSCQTWSVQQKCNSQSASHPGSWASHQHMHAALHNVQSWSCFGWYTQRPSSHIVPPCGHLQNTAQQTAMLTDHFQSHVQEPELVNHFLSPWHCEHLAAHCHIPSPFVCHQASPASYETLQASHHPHHHLPKPHKLASHHHHQSIKLIILWNPANFPTISISLSSSSSYKSLQAFPPSLSISKALVWKKDLWEKFSAIKNLSKPVRKTNASAAGINNHIMVSNSQPFSSSQFSLNHFCQCEIQAQNATLSLFQFFSVFLPVWEIQARSSKLSFSSSPYSFGLFLPVRDSKHEMQSIYCWCYSRFEKATTMTQQPKSSRAKFKSTRITWRKAGLNLSRELFSLSSPTRPSSLRSTEVLYALELRERSRDRYDPVTLLPSTYLSLCVDLLRKGSHPRILSSASIPIEKVCSVKEIRVPENRLAEKKVVDGVGRMNGGRWQKSIYSSLFGCCNRCCRHVYSLLRRCTVMIDGLDDENRLCTRFLFFSLALSLFFPRDSFPDESFPGVKTCRDAQVVINPKHAISSTSYCCRSI